MIADEDAEDERQQSLIREIAFRTAVDRMREDADPGTGLVSGPDSAEELEDIRAFDQAKASGDEAIPFEQATLPEALREHLFLRRFRRLRQELMPYAEAQGIYTDEDVFRTIS